VRSVAPRVLRPRSARYGHWSLLSACRATDMPHGTTRSRRPRAGACTDHRCGHRIAPVCSRGADGSPPRGALVLETGCCAVRAVHDRGRDPDIHERVVADQPERGGRARPGPGVAEHDQPRTCRRCDERLGRRTRRLPLSNPRGGIGWRSTASRGRQDRLQVSMTPVPAVGSWRPRPGSTDIGTSGAGTRMVRLVSSSHGVGVPTSLPVRAGAVSVIG
jgi:hypothetical protein